MMKKKIGLGRAMLSPYLLFATVIFIIFIDFFIKGYPLLGNHDREFHVIPFHIFSRLAFQQASIPQWNPYIFCGSSFFSTSVNLFFYPLYWLIYSFPAEYLPVLLTINVIFHMFLSGVFSYIFFREFSQERFWPLCGALAYMLSSTLMINAAEEFMYLGLVYLPLLLYLIHTYDKRSLLRNIVFQTITYALLCTTGGVQTIIYVLATCIAYVLYRSLIFSSGLPKIDVRLLCISYAGMVLAFGITAIRILPFIYDSKYYFTSLISYPDFLTTLTEKEALIRLFMPHIFGETMNSSLLHVFFMKIFGDKAVDYMNNFEAFACYIGVFPVFFALYSFLFIWKKENCFWKMLILLILLTITGTPLAYLHFKITGSTNVHFGRLAWLLPVCFCALFVHSADVIIKERKHTKRFLFFSLASFALILLISLLVGQYAGEKLHENVFEQFFFVKALFHFSFFSFLLFFLGFYLIVSKSNNSINVFKFLFCLFLIIDLLIIADIDNHQMGKFLEIRSPFRNEMEQYLSEESYRNKTFRVLGEELKSKSINFNVYNMSGQDQGSPLLISTLYSFPVVVNRMDSRLIGPISPLTYQRVCDLTSTRFIYDKYNNFIINESALPRFSLFYKYIIADKQESEILLALSPSVNIHDKVILEKNPDITISANTPKGKVSILKENINDLLIETNTLGNAILLLTDTFYNGWEAYVDGNKTEIIRANYAFKAVAIPQGIHKVLFRFIHKRYLLGRFISILSLLVLFSLIVLLIAFERMNRAGHGGTMLDQGSTNKT